MKNMWKNGILGVVVGDALGEPVQFESRAEVATHPVTGMRGHGTFDLPVGSWTDDSSLTLALLDSLNKTGEPDLKNIMGNFVQWLINGEYTPFGFSYDIGRGTMNAIRSYMSTKNPFICGGRSESNNGNGSLMRILPACLYCVERGLDDNDAIDTIHSIGGLTHAHVRSKIACGLYYFMAKSVIECEGTLGELLQKGIDNGFLYYESHKYDAKEIAHYARLRDLETFAIVDRKDISSSGYVVDTIEAAVWSLITTDSYKNALLRAVNLGLDTDTVGAVTGGIAGLFYGTTDDYGIPEEWIDVIQRKDWIIDMCNKADNRIAG